MINNDKFSLDFDDHFHKPTSWSRYLGIFLPVVVVRTTCSMKTASSVTSFDIGVGRKLFGDSWSCWTSWACGLRSEVGGPALTSLEQKLQEFQLSSHFQYDGFVCYEIGTSSADPKGSERPKLPESWSLMGLMTMKIWSLHNYDCW